MSSRLIWRESASDDLLDLYNWIAQRADFATAFEYTRKVEDFADRLLHFPRKGTPHDDLQQGLRSVVYSGRTILFYTVRDDNTVEIIHVSHGGRDLNRMFDEDE